MAILPEQETTSYYLEDGVVSLAPAITVNNCSGQSNGKFLMIALGPEVIEFEDNVRGLNFTGDFGLKKCELSGNPLPNPTSHEKRELNFKEDWKFLKSCIDVIVEDEGIRPLNVPEKQVGCDLKLLSKNKASFNGGFCFFRPNFGSTFKIKLEARAECKNLSSLKKLSLNTNELLAGLNFYSAGDASGSSVNLTALSNTKLKISINPFKDVLPASDNFNLSYPSWPEIWSAPDVHLAEMNLYKKGEERIEIEMPMIVDNNCPASCREGICQSSCDYSQPIVAEFSLYELKNGKSEILTTWYDGGITPAKFQGTIKGIKNEIPISYLEKGKTYRIEGVFIDPKYDYDAFKKRIRTILNNIRQRLGRIGNSGIPTIQPIPTINESRTLPILGKIPEIVFDRPINEIDRMVEQLRSYLSYRLWPPYYSNICYDKYCIKTEKNFMTLGVDFEILDSESEDKLNYQVIRNFRKSLLVPNYEKKYFPKLDVKCTEIESEGAI